MNYFGLDAPDVLCGGSWRPDGKSTLRWFNDAQPSPRTRDDLHLLIACPTCHAKVDETCVRGTRSDGFRGRGAPHKSRLAPRLCRCGAGLGWMRQLCDACRDADNRANKRDYMRRLRAAKTLVSQGETTCERDTMGAQIKTAPMGALTPNTGASPTDKESTDA